MSKKKQKHLFSKIVNNEELISCGYKLVANIKFRGVNNHLKVISVISASKNDGKSTVAIQLANALALSNYNTLLIDSDLHHKSISRSFSGLRKANLFDVIEGKAKIEEAINPTEVDKLYFLDCANGIISNPEMLASNRFVSLFEILKNNFDYIIIDTPPILACVDGILLSQLSDGAVVVFRQYKTKVDEVKQVSEQLEISDVKVVGCILNFGDRSEYKYY